MIRETQHRRSFLKHQTASLIAAGAASSTTFGNDLPKDDPTEINIRLKPDPSCPGLVIVPLENLTFVTYYGAPVTIPDRLGTCVVTFQGCVAHQFRAPGDEMYASHMIDLESLEPCQTYRVKRSRWVGAAHRELGRPTPSYAHFIFTFYGLIPDVCERGVHFECLAQDFQVDFFGNTPFDEILEQMHAADVAAGV